MERTGSEDARTMERYEALRKRGSRAAHQGRLEEALRWFGEACDVAADSAEPAVRDLAYCNRAAVAIRLDQGDEHTANLQQILLRTSDSYVAWLSAYNLSLHYDRAASYKRALFYGRIALRYSEDLEDAGHRASALNQIGNVLAAMNQFETALEHFRRADELLHDRFDPSRASILDNLGYSLVVLGRYPEAFSMLFQSLRIFRRHRSYLEADPRLALCFAYLHIGRPGRAIHHGNRALEIAEDTGDPRTAKYSLLLLGEAYKLAGRRTAARECFDLLQQVYYPDMPQVPSMLFGLDLCKVINLRA